jgi:hypothetical protein
MVPMLCCDETKKYDVSGAAAAGRTTLHYQNPLLNVITVHNRETLIKTSTTTLNHIS